MRHINGVYTQRHNKLKKRMERFLEEDIKRFYSPGNVTTVLGDKAFKEKTLEQLKAHHNQDPGLPH